MSLKVMQYVASKRRLSLSNFIFRSPCISIYASNETNLMHYLSSVYSVTIPLHVSGLLVSHHQEVTTYICNKWYVLYDLDDHQLASLGWDCPIPTRPAYSQLKRTTRTICCIYTLLPPDDGQLARPKHVEA
jgi:hypothetical protein